MNARSQVFEFSCEGCMVQDIVSSMFSTVLFHRTLGKFRYHGANAYSAGSVGFEDVDLPVLDMTHVRCSSVELHRRLDGQLQRFAQLMAAVQRGQISLEFFQRRRATWPFKSESMPWEVWTLRLETVALDNERERRVFRERVVDVLTERLHSVVRSMNRPQYLPHTPPEAELDLVFDTSLSDVQPYLHRVGFQTADFSNPSVGTTVKKLIKDTLSM